MPRERFALPALYSMSPVSYELRALLGFHLLRLTVAVVFDLCFGPEVQCKACCLAGTQDVQQYLVPWYVHLSLLLCLPSDNVQRELQH